MFSAVCLVTFMVYCASAERISNIDSPTWNRRTTTDDYSYSGRDRDRSPSYDSESVRNADSDSRWGSASGSATDRPGSSWNRKTTADPDSEDRWGTASKRPGGFTYSWEAAGKTTPYRSSYWDRYSTTESSYNPGGRYDHTNRRSNSQTDRWGDSVDGGTTRYRSPYVTDRPDRWSDDSSADRSTPRRSWLSGRDTTAASSWLNREREPSGSRFDRDNAYVRVNVALLKLTNDKGITEDGGKCDTFGQCDPVLSAIIDTERPNAEFPGTRDPHFWPVVYETDDKNSPDLTKANLTKDVCGAPYRDATVRVWVQDKDSINANDIIGRFNCEISREPDSSERLSTWHNGNCVPVSKTQGDKIRLTFKYQVYQVSHAECDPSRGVTSNRRS